MSMFQNANKKSIAGAPTATNRIRPRQAAGAGVARGAAQTLRMAKIPAAKRTIPGAAAAVSAESTLPPTTTSNRTPNRNRSVGIPATMTAAAMYRCIPCNQPTATRCSSVPPSSVSARTTVAASSIL